MFLSKFKYMLLAVVLLSGLDVVLAKPAYADVDFCNATSYPILIAYRTQNGTASSNYFMTVGWLKIDTQSCARVYNGNASLFYHDIAMVELAPNPYFIRIDGEPTYYYCVRADDFSYTGTPTSCPSDYFVAPFYRWSTDRYNARFTIN